MRSILNASLTDLYIHQYPSLVGIQQRAFELLLTGKPVSAKEAHDRYNMVNRLVEVAKSTSEELGQAAVDQAAIELAMQITQNSPDSVLVTKAALVLARIRSGMTLTLQREPICNRIAVECSTLARTLTKALKPSKG